MRIVDTIIKKLDFIGVGEFFERFYKDKEDKIDLIPQLEQLTTIDGSTWGRGIEFDPGYDTEFVSKADLKVAYWDSTNQNALRYLALAIMKKIGLYGYYHERKEFVDLVNNAIEEIDGSVENALEDLIKKAIFFGWAVSEMPYKISKKKGYTWGWMTNHNSEDISFKTVIDIETGREFISSVCINSDYNLNNSFPAHRFIIAQYGDMSNVYGHGQGHYIEKFYKLKIACLKYWGVFLNRFVYPIIIGTSMNGDSLITKLGKLTWKNILHVLPTEKVEILQTKVGLNPGQSYQETIEFCTKEIWKNFFMPPLLEGGEKGGSYALGKTQWALFNLACDKLADYFKENILLTQMVQPLIEWNYGPQNDYGSFESETSLSNEELKELADVYNLFVGMGVLDPISDNEWIRSNAGFPDAKEDELTENKMRDIINETTENIKEEYSKNSQDSEQIRESISEGK